MNIKYEIVYFILGSAIVIFGYPAYIESKRKAKQEFEDVKKEITFMQDLILSIEEKHLKEVVM